MGADVEVIAKAFNGGGHLHASGFKIPLTIAVKDATVQSMLDAQYALLHPVREEPRYFPV